MARTGRVAGFFVDFQPMSPEEMQRTMQFLLSQQARFAADLAKNEARWTERFNQLTEGLLGLTRIVGELPVHLGECVGQSREADARLESNLNVLIGTFERHLRDDHGRAPS